MNRRLQQFLELEQLTPSRLADIMGIQRSGLSHILSGRNKPGYDFLNKLLKKFPQINAEWLITGNGKPYKELNQNITPQKESSELFSYSADNEVIIQEDNVSQPFENHKTEIKTEEQSKNKDVKRITLFFSDGSYKEFYPNK